MSALGDDVRRDLGDCVCGGIIEELGGSMECTKCDSPQLATRLALAASRDAGASSSWRPVDLGPVLDGERLDDPPTLLARADGPCLLYRGRVHSVFGEPEAGKGWLALTTCAEQLRAGNHVLYIDFEDQATTAVERLVSLGLDRAGIEQRFHYVRPHDALNDEGRRELDALLQHSPTLAILDGVTEAYALHGLAINDNDDAAKWQALLPRRLAARGVAVFEIDHVTKDKDNRGRYAIGAQHKLAGVDVAYALVVISPFGRGREGVSKLTVEKDRPGFVREHQESGKRIAEFRLKSADDGTVEVALEPPDRGGSNSFRPTGLMERISRTIEDAPGLGVRAIRDAVKGKNGHIDLALGLLVGEGYVRTVSDGKAVRHHSERPFREDSDTDPALCAPTCPEPNGAHAEAIVPRAPSLTGGTGTSTDSDARPVVDRAPDLTFDDEPPDTPAAGPPAFTGNGFVECAYPSKHRDRHGPHPVHGSTHCPICHPWPAGVSS